MSSIVYDAAAAVDTHLLRPVIKHPLEKILEAATLKLDQVGKPTLDSKGNPEGFYPFGAALAATIIAAGVLKFSHMICYMTLPRCVRSHAILATRIAIGTALFNVVSIATQSVKKQLSQT